jgi:hypothetical protein
MRITASLFTGLLILSTSLFAQDSERSIQVNFISESIKLDGVLDEAAWQSADFGGDFWQYFPSDSAISNYPTEFRLVYDELNLYIGIRGQAASNNYVVSSLRRDFRGTTSDNVTLMFDTYSDGRTAFLFGMTPYGVQREALISQGGERAGFNPNWDQKWQLESKRYDGYFVMEASIPLTSMKFREGDTQWRVQCYRWDIGANEQSAWAHVPQNQLLSHLAFMGTMVFEKPLGKSRTPFAIIPYVNALSAKEYDAGTTTNKLKFGGDAKIAIGNSMNLDLTVNPDFSNVEVDDIFTNLTRFEVFLPEKRQFFMDNSDLFSSFGSATNANPFFSRRIGLARDTTGNLIENRIIAGARLSGNLNDNWRLGVLNMQTDKDTDNGIPSNNNMMFALQRKVFSRSSVGIFMVNRQAIQEYDFLEENETYNRVLGLDYNLASANNTWIGKFYLHKSFQPNDNKGNLSSQATLTYNTRKWQLSTDFAYVDRDFTSDLGFIPRKDVFKLQNTVSRTFYPASGMINTNSFSLQSTNWLRPTLDLQQTDYQYSFIWTAGFKNTAILEAGVSNNYVYLLRDFDPARKPDGVPLPANSSYTFNQFEASYISDLGNLFTYNLETTLGQFYNGNIYSAGGQVAFRWQPWASFSLALNYDGIRLPAPYSTADYWLLTPRVDITFSRSLFWSTLVQYSNQRDNLGINSRLQWRFAPLSDLYLVYNDNYITSDFGPRFRSINLKVSYWLSI